ncbi:HAD family phosphatase [Mycobacterium sp. M1]|uniref:HAD family phosphatase n=1 Tax=Mycolicibacter acidiphilus TaxID=2835306 RepID=A0ABS5RDU3_9MYCO|nr:HAD family phosphatase [Mycolicibacter acidiphilus]
MSAVVFDCDGLLLDTESCWSRAEASLFADRGFDFGPAEKDLLIGRTVEAACANMAAHFGHPGQGRRLEAELFSRVEAELAVRVDPMPGAVRLLNLLAGRIPIAVATNSPRALLTTALRTSGLDRFFGVTVAADEVDRPKPDPQLYLRAFELLGAAPQTGVALEDSATGVAAARAAGAFLVTVPSQPGRRLDGDYLTDALDDPALLDWAVNVQPRG